ncbi:MAG TPA: hypothetical protein PLA50_01965 [Bacteroidia bacterium]|nr:hypothetical protein [Bacteroidia bacterium]
MSDERYSVVDYDSRYADRAVVVDSRTPLSALLEGEPEERRVASAVVDQAARRIAERVAEEVELDADWLAGLLRAEIEAEILEVRAITLRTLLRYFWQDAKSPWDAMKTLLAATRLAASSLICGVSQTEVAFLLQETKAATRAREKRKVEDLLRQWGVQGFHLEGGQKSESAREIYRQVQKGNRNRAKDKTKTRR